MERVPYLFFSPVHKCSSPTICVGDQGLLVSLRVTKYYTDVPMCVCVCVLVGPAGPAGRDKCYATNFTEASIGRHVVFATCKDGQGTLRAAKAPGSRIGRRDNSRGVRKAAWLRCRCIILSLPFHTFAAAASRAYKGCVCKRAGIEFTGGRNKVDVT